MAVTGGVPPMGRGWRGTAHSALGTWRGWPQPVTAERGGDLGEEGQAVPSATVAFPCSSGQLLLFMGDLDMLFLREKFKNQLFLSAQPKAALRIQTILLYVTEQSGKGRNMDSCLPNEKGNCSSGFFTLCTEHAAGQRHRYKTHNNSQKQTGTEMGAWLHPTGA